MTIRASVFIATSLDGFISRKDGSIDWLNEANASLPQGEDCGYKAFADSIDVLVMGRNTFDLVRTFDTWPYGDKQVVVLSSQSVDIPPQWQINVSHSSAAPDILLQQLEARGFRHAYIDGGITIQRFLRAGLINEITVTLIPILLGEGRSLFGALEKDVKLKLERIKTYEFGFVQVTYSPQ